MVSLAGIGGILSGIGSIAGAFGGGGTSRKRELDSYRLQSQAQMESVGPMVAASRKAYVDAGYHPLVAVGNVPQFNPGGAVVGDSGPSVGDRLQLAGQGIGRAASALASKEDRIKQDAMDTLTLERMKLQNDLLRAQTSAVHLQSRPPAVADGPLNVSGQGNSGIQILPKEIISHLRDREVGVSPTHQTFNYGGHKITAPSQAFKQAIEDSPTEWLYHFQHTIPDMLGASFRNVARDISRQSPSILKENRLLRFLDSIYR
nr:MAG: DNA pilot protein [Microvirus sp.]